MRHCFEQPDLPALAFRKHGFYNRPATLEGGGGGKGSSAPSAPDPIAVANATTQTNNATAAYNKSLNLNNYSNPFGSQQSTQTGTDPTTGAPIYGTTISANPQLQGLFNTTLAQTQNGAGIADYASNGLGGILNQSQGLNQGISALGGQYSNLQGQLGAIGSSIDPNAAKLAQQQGQDAAYAAQTQYLDPQFSQGQSSIESQLANQGLTPGSQAYTNAMTNFNNSKQQAYSNAQNQSILTGSQIGQQMLNNQLNTANTQAGLIGQQGSMVGDQAGLFGLQSSNLGQQAGLYGQQNSIAQQNYGNLGAVAGLIPGYSGTGQSASSPANIAQLYQNQYQGQLNNYNQQVGSSNSAMSGLFGLGAASLLSPAGTFTNIGKTIGGLF